MGADAALWKVTGWLARNDVGFVLLSESAGEGNCEGFVDKKTFEHNLKSWLDDHRDDDSEVTKQLLAWVDDLPWVDDDYLRVFIWS